MVFLSPLADWLEHEWEKKTKNRGPRALGSLVEALDELVHHYEAKLDRDQKKQVSTCVRQLRRRVSHVRNSLNSLGSGSDSSGSDESDSGSDGDGAPLGERKKRKKKKAKDFSNTQQAMMKTAIRDALGDDYGGRPSGVGSASAVVASLDEGLGREDGKKKDGGRDSPGPDEKKAGESTKPSPSKGRASLKGAIRKISLGLKLKRAMKTGEGEASTSPIPVQRVIDDYAARVAGDAKAAGKAAGDGAVRRPSFANIDEGTEEKSPEDAHRAVAAPPSPRRAAPGPRRRARAAPVLRRGRARARRGRRGRGVRDGVRQARGARVDARDGLRRRGRGEAAAGGRARPWSTRGPRRPRRSRTRRPRRRRRPTSLRTSARSPSRRNSFRRSRDGIADAAAPRRSGERSRDDPWVWGRRPRTARNRRRRRETAARPRAEPAPVPAAVLRRDAGPARRRRARRGAEAAVLGDVPTHVAVAAARNGALRVATGRDDTDVTTMGMDKYPKAKADVRAVEGGVVASLEVLESEKKTHRRSSKEMLEDLMKKRRSREEKPGEEEEKDDTIGALPGPGARSRAGSACKVIPEAHAAKAKADDFRDPVAGSSRGRGSRKFNIPQIFGGAKGHEILGSPRRMSASLLSSDDVAKLMAQTSGWSLPVFRRLSAGRLAWDGVVAVVCIMTFVVVTLRVGFGCPANRTSERILELLGDAIMLLDWAVTARTTFVDSNTLEEVNEGGPIWDHYTRTPHAAVDAISALPTLRWLGAWGLVPATGGLAGRPGVCDVVHLIKVLRMTRIWRLNLIKSAVSGSGVNPSALRFGGLMFSSMGTLHVIACVYWYVCRRVWPTRRWDNSEWLPYLHGDRTGAAWEHGKVPSLEVIASAYSWASYWAISNA
ncbi:cyclic nucleotide-gated ion channel [Aureococcus anophagefferens]|nr:cyclic nucleotide-gated ion channel [Aureococcus anophagefferens]